MTLHSRAFGVKGVTGIKGNKFFQKESEIMAKIKVKVKGTIRIRRR